MDISERTPSFADRRKGWRQERTVDKEILSQIYRGMKARQLIEVFYNRRSDGEDSYYTVEPYSIRWRPAPPFGGLALYAYDRSDPVRKRIKAFYIGRIFDINQTFKVFRPRWTIEDYRAQDYGIRLKRAKPPPEEEGLEQIPTERAIPAEIEFKEENMEHAKNEFLTKFYKDVAHLNEQEAEKLASEEMSTWEVYFSPDKVEHPDTMTSIARGLEGVANVEAYFIIKFKADDATKEKVLAAFNEEGAEVINVEQEKEEMAEPEEPEMEEQFEPKKELRGKSEEGDFGKFGYNRGRKAALKYNWQEGQMLKAYVKGELDAIADSMLMDMRTRADLVYGWDDTTDSDALEFESGFKSGFKEVVEKQLKTADQIK